MRLSINHCESELKSLSPFTKSSTIICLDKLLLFSDLIVQTSSEGRNSCGLHTDDLKCGYGLENGKYFFS